jgi:hypothetical protein
MKTALILAAAAALASSSAAYASSTLTCTVYDSQGSSLTYGFADNSAGTVVDTVFKKNNTTVQSDVGQRPIWIARNTPSGGLNFFSRAAPGWKLAILGDDHVILTHNGRVAGDG